MTTAPPTRSCLRVSAKTGLGVPALLEAIVDRIPPPTADPNRPLKLLLFDAFHDEYRCGARRGASGGSASFFFLRACS